MRIFQDGNLSFRPRRLIRKYVSDSFKNRILVPLGRIDALPGTRAFAGS
jgi:hypothetical protein